MEIIKAILFGIVEGITEWLPISSTGHMILLNEFINLNVSKDFYSLFEVVIQLGAIMAVVVMYFKTIWPFGFGKTKKETKETFNLWGKILVACVPAAIIGILLDDWLDAHLYNSIVVSLMLIIYGIIFIVVESKNMGKGKTENLNDITYKQALGVGVFQLLSLIPGTSRSGATIIGGLILGLKRSVAAQFTFFLAIPVMFGASALKLFKFGFNYTFEEVILLLVGMVVAFIVSIISIKFLLRYVRTNDFKAFGWYRIILGLIVFAYFYFQG